MKSSDFEIPKWSVLRCGLKSLFLHQQVDDVIDTLLVEQKYLYVDDVEVNLEKLFAIENRTHTLDQNKLRAKLFAETYPNGIFQALEFFVKDSCVLNGALAECKTDALHRWHEMSSYLSEDFLVCSYYASSNIELSNFAWKPFIDIQNANIKEITDKELADIHAHLKGSSFNFDINWMCLMNNIEGRENLFNDIQSDLRKPVIRCNYTKTSRDYYTLAIIACAIRLYFFGLLVSNRVLSENDIKDVLSMDDKLDALDYIGKLTQTIETFTEEYGRIYDDGLIRKEVLDYANTQEIQVQNPKETCAYSTLSGERYILYNELIKIYKGNATNFDTSLLYIYLLIKLKVRNELVQSNEIVGFSNFDKYESRKTIFIRGYDKYSMLLVHLSVASFFEKHDENRWHETRIAPKDTAKKNIDALERLEKEINTPLLKKKLVDWKYGYIYHFIKESDNTDAAYFELKVRHEDYRKTIKQQAKAIAELNENNQLCGKTQHRVVGIDAANSEIGCRPEVFAHAFRFLRSFGYGITFHVGEDFLDVIDGIRAIDECITFMNFRKGDRLGHALALGVNVGEYYSKRKNTLVISQQMQLDNIVWLYMQLQQSFCYNSIKGDLLKQYELLFPSVFGSDKSVPSIDTYYHSWLLRGDEPLLYKAEGATTEEDELDINWFKYSMCDNKVVVAARNNIEAKKLFYQYHHDKDVKTNGNCLMTVEYSQSLIKAISAVQKKMLNKVEKLKLAIECNPTSNFKIGDINRYDEHPISKFYSKGLRLCGGYTISSSINTDDKGVFATSIEREYALIATALIRKYCNDEKAESKVVKWLDDVRKISLNQKFIR